MSVCAIVLSYKRPQNMDRVILPLCESAAIDKVIVSNNNPEIDLRDALKRVMSEPKVELIQQAHRSICAKRFEIALHQPFDAYLCPDDDLFLTSTQIDALIDALAREPTRVHGVFGEIHSFRDGRLQLGGGICGIECEVDILNRCYAFTRAHLLQMAMLASELGYGDVGNALFVDDMLISHCGDGAPICHDFGPLDSCPTSDMPGIATYKEAGFDEARVATYLRLARSGLVQGSRR
jgi:hypothetical protein